ncbi:hypothetical protein [Streptomyces apocyni]|uniref:hypothetical protein n=1 Tax=Streptomyces apocyni TaxID=2654677 RepID=UPI0012E9B634|nr:hypothetical protein [Streptomyces apocyni]
MSKSKSERKVIRRRSFPILSWIIVIILGILAVAAAGKISPHASRGPLIGVAACLATIALVRRILCSRIVLETHKVKVVNPVFTYSLPCSHIARVGTAASGTLTLRTKDGDEVHATAFGGSLLDHFVGTSDRAAGHLKDALQERRSLGGDDITPRRAITVSWIADGCLVGAIIALIVATVVPG